MFVATARKNRANQTSATVHRSRSMAIGLLGILIANFVFVSLPAHTAWAATDTQTGDTANAQVYLPIVTSAAENMNRESAVVVAQDLLARAQTEGSVRVIVRFAAPTALPTGDLQAADANAQQMISEVRGQVVASLATINAADRAAITPFTYLPLVALEATHAQLQTLAAHPQVVAVFEDEASAPDVLKSGQIVGAKAAWADGYTGAGQTIVVIDTGVDSSHPALAGKVVDEACFSSASKSGTILSTCPNGQTSQTGPGAGAACSQEVDGCDHGTHVAGIALGNGEGVLGVAREAKLIAIQVFSVVDDETFCQKRGLSTPCATTFVSDYVQALEHVYSIREDFTIAAVNMSLGGRSYSSQVDCDLAMTLTGVKPIVDALRTTSIAVVMSSGNSGETDAIGRPSCLSSAISVGATTGSDRVAEFSNSASFLDLLAPGVGISSAVPGGKTRAFNGTSMAAPHVAGAWAVLKSKRPDAAVDQILTVLSRTGRPIRDARNDITKPRIQIDKALAALPASGPAALVSASRLSFGEHAVTRVSQALSVTLTNEGDAPLAVVDISINGNTATEFVVVGNTGCRIGAELAWGESCTVRVKFVPQTTGKRTATLRIETNDPRSPHRVALSGTGMPEPQPALQLSAASLQFKSQIVGVAGNQLVVELTNEGAATLAIANISAAGDFAQSHNCGAKLAPGKSCTVRVQFTPSVADDCLGQITIDTNAPDSPHVVSLKGAGLPSGIGRTNLSDNGGGHVTSTDGQISVLFPEQAGVPGMTVTLEPSEQPPAHEDRYELLGQAFQVKAFAADGTPIETAAQPYTLDLSYSDTILQAAGAGVEYDFDLYYWDGSEWKPVLPCNDCTHDANNYRITVQFDKLTHFALMTSTRSQVYLPFVTGS